MITAILEAVIRFRWIVVCGVAGLAALSIQALRTAALDAIPDISDPQIVVYVKWPRSPLVIESEITEPVIRALSGSTDIRALRGTSHMGYSFVYVVLEDPARRAEVRQLVADRMAAIRSQLPPDADVALGPDATSMGWIFQYALVDREGTRDLRELRVLNDNVIKPVLQSAAGVAEVASIGGLERQYQVKLFPPLLSERGISLRRILAVLQGTFEEAGGRTIEVTGREYQLRGSVGSENIDKLGSLVVGRDRAGQPVQLGDVGYVQVGYDLRRGIADLDGAGEVVGGIAIMEQGRNVLAVTRALLQRIETVRSSLPAGVEIVPTYDRSTLIWDTLTNFIQAILFELLVVIVVIAVALRNARAALAPVSVLLLGTLLTALPLAAFGQTINLFLLAGLAIAIGEMADATIVIVENCSAQLARHRGLSADDRLQTIIRATATMTRPLLFSMLIIVTSFLPIFFLGEREGRLFNPLAFSKTFAMAFSTLLTLFLLPVVIVWVFRRPGTAASLSERESAVARGYRRLLVGAIEHRYVFVGASVALLIVASVLMTTFQKDYMPEMDEGSILYMPTTLPGLPSREAGWIVQEMDRKLKAFPEVDRVFGKLGRADSATDPAPVEMIETTIMLKPRSQWRPGVTKDALVAEMNQAMQIVGYVNSWTQPISTRVMMQDTGIQTPVGVKVKGPELSTVQEMAREVEQLLKDVPGTQTVIAERIAQGYFVDVQLDLARMAEHGVTVDEALPTVRFAVGGDNAVRIRQPDDAIVPLAVQYSPEYIDTLEKVRNTPVVTDDGRSVALSRIGDVSVREAPEMVRNDGGELAGYVYVYLRDTTAPEYVDRARAHLAGRLTLPPGYSIEWTGLYQYAEDARSTLRIVVPITLMIMFGLLLMAFRRLADTWLIMLSAPFALIGGVFLQWQQGFSMTTAVIIGYVSLFAVAIQTGIIMIEFIRDALARQRPDQSYMDAVVQGSVARLRPKLMTVATTVLGLLPIMFATGSGMDITKPIATPTFGGMISSTIYVLFLIPCLFAIGEDIRRRWPRRFASRYATASAVVALLLVPLTSGGCGSGVPGGPLRELGRTRSGNVDVVLLTADTGLSTGKDTVTIEFRDSSGGRLVDVGAVRANATMPMAGMAPMVGPVDVRPTDVPGRYVATSELSMAGEWRLSFEWNGPAGQGSASFSPMVN